MDEITIPNINVADSDIVFVLEAGLLNEGDSIVSVSSSIIFINEEATNFIRNVSSEMVDRICLTTYANGKQKSRRTLNTNKDTSAEEVSEFILSDMNEAQ